MKACTFIATAFVVFMAGCSRSVLPPPSPAAHSGGPANLAQTSFVIHWPSGEIAPLRATPRRPQFISPSTESVSITINDPNPLPKVVVNAPAPGRPATTSIKIDAPVGQDSFLIQLWDLSGAQGNVVGQALVTQQIIAGRANTIGATVNGVCTQIAFAPAPGQPFVEAGILSGETALTLVGPQPEAFIATPQDADGNAILAPGGVPKISVSTPAGSGIVAMARGSNQFFLAPNSVQNRGQVVALGVTSPNCLGGARVLATTSAAIYAANFNSSTMTVYDQSGNQITTTGKFPNLSQPDGVAFDPTNARLYVANRNNTITSYNQNGSQLTTAGSFPNVNSPFGITFDPANNRLYVANFFGSITAYDQNGNQIITSGTFPNVNNPQSITFDPIIALLYVSNRINTLTVYDPNGNQVLTSGTFPNLASPESIAFDPANGQLYVANVGNSAITAYDQNGNQLPVTIAFPNVSEPRGIAFDPANGLLYVSNTGNETITVFDQNGNQITTSGSFPNVTSPVRLTIVP